MAEARLDDGQVVTALNEVFVGHESHQSARYTIEVAGRAERQSSSGLIVSTGTGATGWAASINRHTGSRSPRPPIRGSRSSSARRGRARPPAPRSPAA